MNPLAPLLAFSLAVALGPAPTPNQALTATAAVPTASDKVTSECTFRGKKLHGKVKIVSAFPDFKIKKVDAFEDLKVKQVGAFPDSCGKWKFVDAFPDFTIQYVDAFPDFTVKFVDAFPGL